jgi:hypothetical protein
MVGFDSKGRKVKLTVDSRVNAYNEAIAYLNSEECSYDKKEDKAARLWLAKKLDKECQRWFNRINS